MFFQSESRRLKSAIAAQDASLGRALVDLAQGLNLDMAGKMGMKAMGVARAHPVPVALAGAGLAWLILRPKPAVDQIQDQVAQKAGAAIDSASAMGEDWMAAARDARDTARDRMLDLYERGLATAEARAAVAADQAEALSAAFRSGLSHLGDEAADMAAATRRRAYEALEQGGRMAAKGYDQGRKVAQEHPVATVTGLAVGAGLLALAWRGRGILKVLTPVALAAAVAETVRQMRRTPVEEAAEEVADAVRKTSRRTTRAATKAAEGAKDAVVKGTAAASRKTKAEADKAATKTTAAARRTAKAADGAVRKAARTVKATAASAEDEMKNGAATTH